MVVTADYWTTSSGEDQPGQWQALLSETHLPWRVDVAERRPGDRFEARARRWWIDDLALVDCECEPCLGSRRRPELARLYVLPTFGHLQAAKLDAELRPGGTATARARPRCGTAGRSGSLVTAGWATAWRKHADRALSRAVSARGHHGLLSASTAHSVETMSRDHPPTAAVYATGCCVVAQLARKSSA